MVNSSKFHSRSFGKIENLPLCSTDKQNAAESLIEIGADVHAKDSQGNTPLHLVAYFSGEFFYQLLRLLTVFYRCIFCTSGSVKMAKILIEKGNAKPYLLNKERISPLEMAKEKGKSKTGNTSVFIKENLTINSNLFNFLKHLGYTDLAKYIDSNIPWYITLLEWLVWLGRIFGRRGGR